MSPQNPKVDIGVSASGLPKVKAGFLEMAGSLAEPILALAAGASKVEAAWVGISAVVTDRMLGPLSLVSGAALGALLAIKKLGDQFGEIGVVGAASLERIETQFRPLMRSAALAKERVKELIEASKETPWKQDEVLGANKALQILTQGALAGKAGMNLVGDAAATAGADFQATAMWIGRLYDGLQSGAPIGEATMRLSELGVISGTTRRAINSLSESGASFTESWGVVENELLKAKGSMKELSKTMEGMQSTYQDTVKILGSTFGQGFLEGEKAALESTTKAIDRLTPAAEFFGEILGSVSNSGKKFKAFLLDSVTAIPGFVTGVKLAGVGVMGLLAALAAAGGASVAKFLVSIVSSTIRLATLTKATGSAMAAQNAQTAVSLRLAAANAALAAATQAAASGQVKLAASCLQTAAAETTAAVRTNAFAASTLMLRGALNVLSTAFKFVIVQIRAMLVAIVTNPILLAVTAVMALGAGFIALTARAARAKQALDDFSNATRDLTANLEAQRKAIETANDLMKAHASAIDALAIAKQALIEAEKSGNAEMAKRAKERIAMAESEVAAIRDYDQAKLALGDEEMTRMERDHFAAKQATEEQRRETMDRSSPEKQAAGANAQLEKVRAERQSAMDELARQKNIEQAQRSGRFSEVSDAQVSQERARLSALKKRRDKAQGDIERSPSAASAGKSGALAPQFRELEYLEAEIPKVTAALAEMEKSAAGSKLGLEIALAGDSEIKALQAKIALYDQYKEAARKAEAAAGLLKEANSKDDKDTEDIAKKTEELERQQEALRVLGALAADNGVDTTDSAAQSKRRGALSIRSKELEDALDPGREAAARAEAERAGAEIADRAMNARLTTEQAILGMKDDGLAAELRSLELEKEKVRYSREREKISAAEFYYQLRAIDAQAAAARRRSDEAKTRALSEVKSGRLDDEEAAARRVGDVRAATARRSEADAERLLQRQRELEKEARDMFETEGDRADYVKIRMAGEKAALAQRRKFQDEDSAIQRRSFAADEDARSADLQANILSVQGREKESKELKKQADAIRDKQKTEELTKRLMSEGFGAEEAKGLAEKSVLMDQAQRKLSELGNGGGNVVASSLAQIGGSGGVAGVDRLVSQQKVTNDLLKQIRDKEASMPKTGVAE
jgi:hypothetical protein